MTFDRQAFRRELGQAILDIQDEYQADGVPSVTFVLEMIAALMSLAAYIAKHNAHLSRTDWMRVAREGAKEQWP